MKLTDLTAIISIIFAILAIVCIAIGLITNDIQFLPFSTLFGILFIVFGIITANVDDN